MSGTNSSADSAQRHRGVTLAVIVAVQLMVVLDGTVVNIALPTIQSGLHFSTANLSWVINAYILAFGGFLLLGGRAGDVLGRRQMFMGGIAVFTVASLVGGLATTSGMLVASRAVQGIGAAAAAPSALALLATNFAEGSERNRALAIFSGVSSGGSSAGLLLGGALTGISWRWVLFINVPLGIVALYLAPKYLQNSERHRGRIDYLGALTSIVGMCGLVFGLIRSAADGWGDPVAIGSLAAGVVVLATFISVETRAEVPIVPLRLLRSPTRAGAYGIMLLLPSAMLGVFFYLAQFLQEGRGYSPLATGIAFLPMTALIFAIARVTPKLLPRFGARRMAIFGVSVATIGFALFTTITPRSNYVLHILVPLVFLAVGYGASFMPINVTILSGVQSNETGAASSLLQTMQQVGGALGLSVLVTVVGSATHHAKAPPGATHLAVPLLADGVRYAFVTSTILAALSLVLVVAFLRPGTPSGEAAEMQALHDAETIIDFA